MALGVTHTHTRQSVVQSAQQFPLTLVACPTTLTLRFLPTERGRGGSLAASLAEPPLLEEARGLDAGRVGGVGGLRLVAAAASACLASAAALQLSMMLLC